MKEDDKKMESEEMRQNEAEAQKRLLQSKIEHL